MDALGSASRHGVARDDMRHALENALLLEEIGEDPVRWLILGPARAGTFLSLSFSTGLKAPRSSTRWRCEPSTDDYSKVDDDDGDRSPLHGGRLRHQ